MSETPVAEPPARTRRVANPERLAADRELYERLVADEFTGPRFELFREELWRYGWRAMLKWMGDGTIIERCREHDILFYAPWPEIEEIKRRPDIREEIASFCVHLALTQFIELLEVGYWKPDKGATLRTFFIGSCLFAFRDAYKNWAAGYRRNLKLFLGPAASGELVERESRGLGQEHMAVLRETLDLILEDASMEARAICELMLTMPGGTQEEVGKKLGKSRKSVERHISRVRARALNLAAAGTILRPSTSSAVTA
ncbi:hypothetical protein [Streptomyces sp. NPDC059513]|uniref:hypothetical protein n=1 Tax=unclassified Streptomyces TaxID=2593676 RepID=UPI0036A98537